MYLESKKKQTYFSRGQRGMKAGRTPSFGLLNTLCSTSSSSVSVQFDSFKSSVSSMAGFSSEAMSSSTKYRPASLGCSSGTSVVLAVLTSTFFLTLVVLGRVRFSCFLSHLENKKPLKPYQDTKTTHLIG